ncbi:F-box/LRR-repeat protein 6 isoform X13 [Balaenoptera acutorostrata]|uniref:F-box/LRR-repeat protein 6 isoform X13 n=1 Tax=Balaenoptera acutorostrata TaxID=9767 RepID=A0ABM3SDX5_BALAC|nr:F-box/LRR-repeat protein 6 isoform X13 [Balaenoptera acutorostrata]
MAPVVARRRARQRVRILPLAGARSRSAEDWWWDRLAPSGSGYHLLQSDSMLLVLPGPGPARPRAQRRASRRAQLLRLRGARAAEAKAKPRTAPAPAPAPAPQQEPDPGWGDRIPLEILLQIFGLLVAADGPIPFLGRAARVCRRWHEAASQPALWHTLTLSPPLAGRPAKSGTKTEKKLLASLEWLMPSRFSQLQRLTLIHWKSQVHPVLKLVSESCPRLTFLKLSDCHGVTPDTLIMLAKACPQLHSLDIQHSMVSPGVPRGPKEAWAELTGASVLGLQVESTAVVSFLEEAGPRMRKLWLTYSSQTTAVLGALLVGWSRMGRSRAGCRARDCQASDPVFSATSPGQLLPAAPAPGGEHWPQPQQHSPPAARRGPAERLPPAAELEQLHLGLYGMSDRLTLAKEGSLLLTQKWCHTLQELDLSGQGFSEKDLEQALAAFSGTPGGSHLALCSLNLRGTRVTPGTVSSVISNCPGLLYLNLESCRCLPRGLKRAYRGPEEVQRCLQQLLTSLPPASQLGSSSQPALP